MFLLLVQPAVTEAQFQPSATAPQIPPNRFLPTYEELKSSLGLSDQQIADLQRVQQEKIAGTSGYFKKMQDKRRDLNQLLESPAPDPAKIGQMEIELQQLQKQGPPPPSEAREKTLAILTDEQKLKLAKLEDALKQRPAIEQALQLNLLLPPTPVRPPSPALGPHIMPVPSAPKN